MRLLGAVLVEIDEVWSIGKLYFKMEHYREWKEVNGGNCRNEEKEKGGRAA